MARLEQAQLTPGIFFALEDSQEKATKRKKSHKNKYSPTQDQHPQVQSLRLLPPKSQQKAKESAFEMMGNLRAWVQEPGQPIHAFWLSTPNGNYLIQLAKKARSAVTGLKLLPQLGESVRVIGHYKLRKDLPKSDGQPESAALKLKAEFLQPLNWGLEPSPAAMPQPVTKTKPNTKTKILVCQKSTCRAKGADKIQAAIEDHLQEQGLTNQVTVQATGCLGCCKKAPCLMMPGKDKHQKVRSADIPKLMSAYF
jgi:hypothetical protein